MRKCLLIGISVALISLWACDGDEIIKEVEIKGETVYDTLDVPALPGSRMLEYNVANLADGPIYSAIDHAHKVITVYLPHYYALEFIEPEIVLPEGSKVEPESGELVEVFAETQVTYKVTGKDGTTATYTLNVEIQQPEIVLKELGTATAPYSRMINSGITITGKNFIPNISVTRAYLIDEAGHEIQLTPQTNATERSTTMSFLPVGNAVVIGKSYWIEMRAYALKQRMQYPVQFTLPNATINFNVVTTVRQGETFALQGTYIRDFTYFALQIGVDFVPLTIESMTQTEAVIRVPDDYPVGTHKGRYRYILQGTTRNVVNSASLLSITVEPKVQ
jgi:hypothetical protein